ncbi:MAG: IPT/TIG domain-containing protein, partial [Acidimicrobiales bacterium]
MPIAAAIIGLAAVAFACVPQGSIRLSPTSGPVGTTITVTGSNFTSGSAVKVFWGNPGQGNQVASAVTGANRGFTATFQVPTAPNGQSIVSATQADDSGTAIGSPANALFNVSTPGGATVTPAPNVQREPQSADGAAGLAPADEPAAA